MIGWGQPCVSADEIATADAIVIAADTKIDLSRFAGKPVYETSTKAAIHDGAAVIRAALSAATVDLSVTLHQLSPANLPARIVQVAPLELPQHQLADDPARERVQAHPVRLRSR